MQITHCISGNVERVILYKTAFPSVKKGILYCQKARIGNRERSIYVLHRHFGNPKRLLWQYRTPFYSSNWLFAITANTV